MLSRWWGLFIHARITSATVVCPAATFSPTPASHVPLALDPLVELRAVAPFVGHLLVLGHVPRLQQCGRRELGVRDQRPSFSASALPVMCRDQLDQLGRKPAAGAGAFSS